MRRIDKKNNLIRANILVEQRYLASKGLLTESQNEIEEDWKSNVAAGMMGLGAVGANAQSAPVKPNTQTVNQTAGKGAATQAADPFGVNKTSDKLEFKVSTTFSSGESSVNPNDGEVRQLLSAIQAFSAKNPDAIIKVDIIGSESQVPNQQRLPKGAIATARAKSLGDVISNSVQANIKTSVKTMIGKEQWTAGANKDDVKYTKEQFVIVQVKAIQTSCSLTRVKKRQGTTNTLSSEVGGVINNAMYPGNIPDRMVLTDASGNVLEDTGFFADGNHNYGETVKFVPKYVLELTKLRQANDPATQNIDKSTIVSVRDYNELLSVLFGEGADIAKFMRYENDFGNPLKELKAMVENGGEIVLYSIVPQNVKMINYDLGENTGRINVYSPLKQTDFKLVSDQCK